MEADRRASKLRLGPRRSIALFFVAYLALTLGLDAVWRQAQPATDPPTADPVYPWIDFLGFAQWAAAMVALTFLFWKVVDGRRWSDLRFGLADGRAWLRGLVLALLWYVPALAIPVLLGQSRLESVTPLDGKAILELSLYLLGTFCTSVAAEAVFRGYMLQKLLELMGPGRAIPLSSLLAAVTYPLLQATPGLTVLDLVLGGAALACLRLGTGSLASSIAAATALAGLPYLISNVPTWRPWIQLSEPPANVWFGYGDYSGLMHIWISFFWLLAIYLRYYLPAQASAQPAPEPIARIRPKPRRPR